IAGGTGEGQAYPEPRHRAGSVPPQALGAADGAARVAGKIERPAPGPPGIPKREVGQATTADLLPQYIEQAGAGEADAPVAAGALKQADIGKKAGDLGRFQLLARRRAAFRRQSPPPVVEL